MRVVFNDNDGKLVVVEATSVTWDTEYNSVVIQDGDVRGSWSIVGLTESLYNAAIQQLVKLGYTELFLADGVTGSWEWEDNDSDLKALKDLGENALS